jgi:hypothetical protein
MLALGLVELQLLLCVRKAALRFEEALVQLLNLLRQFSYLVLVLSFRLAVLVGDVALGIFKFLNELLFLGFECLAAVVDELDFLLIQRLLLVELTLAR